MLERCHVEHPLSPPHYTYGGFFGGRGDRRLAVPFLVDATVNTPCLPPPSPPPHSTIGVFFGGDRGPAVPSLDNLDFPPDMSGGRGVVRRLAVPFLVDATVNTPCPPPPGFFGGWISGVQYRAWAAPPQLNDDSPTHKGE